MNWACNVFVSNFLGHVSANYQNLIKSDKDITKIKRVTFLSRHSVLQFSTDTRYLYACAGAAEVHRIV